MRIESLSLMVCDDSALAPAFGSARRVGIAEFGAMPPPDEEARVRYVRSEAVVILHHSAETLLRMYFAHVDYPHCPWLGIASSRTPGEFKDKCLEVAHHGVNRDTVATVFMGGTDPRDAAVRLTDDQFEASVGALTSLILFCAERFLSESFIYNAAKHGLSTVHLDPSTRFEVEPPGGGDRIPISSGSMLTYLHKPERPGSRSGPEWFVSATGTLPDQDLGVALLIQRAVSSLWDVARRRYTGQSGSISVFSPAMILDSVYGPVQNSLNIVRTISFELPKKGSDGSISEVRVNFTRQALDEGWDSATPGFRPVNLVRVDLPRRQRDLQPITVSRQNLLPFSPKGSTRV
ncbi:hypothetical protein JWS13_02430 (plasmid) [Rhodococcus pseudokoreensis]|uniref:Uncharacterized protein n=2 Tax=Rhodococcus pseudokoreensis TaxID=2811421 RepID=A0A974VYN7_9NOCA|nr:hypothetical protein JWS13_02430 [Rhodococcus pseudokoreensis]